MTKTVETISLRILINGLPRKSKQELALRLKCDPSKISRALTGLVRNKIFLARLQAEALKIKEQTPTEV